MDSVDEKIILLLQKDARQSSDSLAKQLEISPSTVRRRLRKLLRDEVVRIGMLVDPDKAGLPLRAVIAFDIAHDKLESAIEVISSYPQIKWLCTMTGQFDVMAMALFRSTNELSDFVEKKLASLEGVKDSETFICLQTKKGHYIQL